jgi:hypothetical protein
MLSDRNSVVLDDKLAFLVKETTLSKRGSLCLRVELGSFGDVRLKQMRESGYIL